MKIETFEQKLPHGITLSCRACGPADAPRLVLLHGFPEGAFVWDEVMASLGSRFRCIAPNLRGYERSSAPREVEAYKAKHLVADIAALIAATGDGPIAALIAHDWGGALAWNVAIQRPQLMQQLIIINGPHPATFLRELQTNPAQQAASAYMNELCEPGAEARLSADDYASMFATFGDAKWLDEATRQQYREAWAQGLAGPLNYYRASPLRPPTASNPGALAVQFAPEFVTVHVPSYVIWGEEDKVLPPRMLDGLEQFVPDLAVRRVPGSGHWIIHEQPALISRLIAERLQKVSG